MRGEITDLFYHESPLPSYFARMIDFFLKELSGKYLNESFPTQDFRKSAQNRKLF